jgi:hypothetical protein
MTTILTDEAKWRLHLLYAVQDCRELNEGMRFGQLLFNAISLHDKANYTSEYDSDFHSRLFNIYDEELLDALEGWFKFQNEQVELRQKKANTST